jgi:hypothetical protein
MLTNVSEPNKLQKFGYPIVIAILLIGGGYTIYTQNNQIKDLKGSKTSLNDSVSLLTKDKTKLATTNTNLTKSYTALKTTQKAIATSVPAQTVYASPASSTTTKTAPVATASLQINNVTVKKMSDFGATNANASNTMRAVNVTMNNLSTKNQTYSVPDFTAITDTGEIVKATVYTNDAGNGTFWNNSGVAAGGSLTESIPFDVNKHIVTLEWTPAGSQPIDLPIPADQ